MKCPPFDYHRATSVPDAIMALQGADGDGKILAGGQSLVPVLALRMARPTVLVDINRIPGLSRLELRDGVLHAGALVRHQGLAEQQLHPLAAETAGWIGHTAIRSRGTVAGSLAHADPSAELPGLLRACGGTVEVSGPTGTRRLGAGELFVGALQSDLDDTEMITAIELPVPDGWGFAEFARRHGDFAIVSVVAARFGHRLRVVVGGVGGVPHLVGADDELTTAHGELTGEHIARFAAAAADEVEPATDLHGSAGYRRALTEQLTARALRHLAGHAAPGRAPVPAQETP